MSVLDRMKTPLKNGSENNVYLAHRKLNKIYFRDTIKQFCPHQRFVDHRPYIYRPFSRVPFDFNYYNSPIEKDSFVPCFQSITNEFLPLVTREDLEKYLKGNSKLIKHLRPCNSCKLINEGNYGRNYYTFNHKSFPFVNGNFTGMNFKINYRLRTPFKVRYKMNDYYNNKINRTLYERQKKANIKNEKSNGNKKIIMRNNSMKFLKTFHKTQIFDHCKPYLVDEFREFPSYE